MCLARLKTALRKENLLRLNVQQALDRKMGKYEYIKILSQVLIICLISSLVIFCCVIATENEKPTAMSDVERESLKEEARDMFYHAYRAYMDNAYPADELMPLSCQGRYRGVQPSRGDIDDTLGNYSLTLIDTLDTLAVLGDLEEFEHAVQLIIQDVSFDKDIVVSVFETNIRVLGGLLSGHVLSEYLQHKAGVMLWYRGELLEMARDLGYRLLPAFNTTTGIPHSRINLRHGLKSKQLEWSKETCTACAGTMVLEMAALSRLSGDPIFEEKAHRAMDELWRLRHRGSDLMGTVLNVHSGDWVRRDSGVGAGIDSYYEYCLKAYILLGDDRYLNRFNRHYSAVMKYISQGPMLLDVHMHRPHTNSRNFMDALLAFWPGLQVLNGDLKPAIETHEMLYQVMQRHNFIPEAFTTDFQVHWGQHPLRPEFLESTYFLYRATEDPHYLQVGKSVLQSLQKFARVPCGYATVKDVRTGLHEDGMDSFVLAETFKYLFLLFASPDDLVVNLDEFIFTTEAHLLPLTLAHSRTNFTVFPMQDQEDEEIGELAQSCPSSLHLFPESVRKPLKNMVDGVCPRHTTQRKLLASQFQSNNVEHMRLVKNMGITVTTLADGRIQLMHAFDNAVSVAEATEGLLFLQEMMELSKNQAAENLPQSVSFTSTTDPSKTVVLTAGPAHFGRQLRGDDKVTARLGVAYPLTACKPLLNPDRLNGVIAIVERGECMFVEKARRLEAAGAVGVIVIDNMSAVISNTGGSSTIFAMSGDGTDDIHIPAVFLIWQEASTLIKHAIKHPLMQVTLGDHKPEEAKQSNKLDLNTLDKIKEAVQDFWYKDRSSENDAETAKLSDPKRKDSAESSDKESEYPLMKLIYEFLATNQASTKQPEEKIDRSLNTDELIQVFESPHMETIERKEKEEKEKSKKEEKEEKDVSTSSRASLKFLDEL